jgi:hypothetical protein
LRSRLSPVGEPHFRICVAHPDEENSVNWIRSIEHRLRDASRYHFVSEWRVGATPDEVKRILADPLRLPEWWPAVYLQTRVLDPGDVSGVGRTILLVTKGWLPYTLRWRLTVAGIQESSLLLLADGDFVGTGKWTLMQVNDTVHVRYEWSVRARKPLLRYLSLVLRPLFVYNHRWAMRRGEESLILEMERRRGHLVSRRAVPPPPPATPHHVAEWVLHLLKEAPRTLGRGRRAERGGAAGATEAVFGSFPGMHGGPRDGLAHVAETPPLPGAIGAAVCK